MLPLQFIFLLIIVTLPGQLVQATSADAKVSPLPAWHSMPAWAAYVALLVSLALVVWYAIVQARRTMRQLHEPSAATTPLVTRMENLFSQARWMTCALTAMSLFLTPLASDVVGWSESTHILKYLLLPELLFMAPAALAWVVMWAVAYFVEEAVRERSLPYALARGQPVHEMPGMGAFLGLQMRHNFYPFLFLLFQGGVRVFAAGLWKMTRHWGWDQEGNWADGIATGAALISFFLVLPALLMKIWSTTPLTGPLRQRLDGVAARYGLRFRQILLWRSQNTLINAAILGWVPRGRYFLMTDGLVESFSDQQLEAVFAHEVGHGVHRHLPWLIAGIFAALGVGVGAADIAVKLLPVDQATGQMIGLMLSTVLVIILAALLIRVISPRFEHQADWFAARHMARALREGTVAEMTAERAAEAVLAAGEAGEQAAGGGPQQTLATALTTVPTPAETVTKEAYIAGQYPHAAATPVAAGGTDAGRGGLPEVVGAEIFISALEAIVETSHRDRERRGWFHPSVMQRAALLRRLALEPGGGAEAAFNRTMRRTRFWILGLAACALVIVGISYLVPDHPPKEQPMTTPATTTSAP